MKLRCTRRGCNNTKDFFIKEAYYCGKDGRIMEWIDSKGKTYPTYKTYGKV